jgi:hypothetical protein
MFEEESALPFFALVGSTTSPTWPETAIGFATFYHLVAKGEYIQDAVKAMCTASGVSEFFVTTAEEERRSYLEYIKTNKIDAGEVRAELKREALETGGDRAG